MVKTATRHQPVDERLVPATSDALARLEANADGIWPLPPLHWPQWSVYGLHRRRPGQVNAVDL